MGIDHKGPTNVDHVRIPKAAGLVATSLRRRIVSGELADGDSLMPESDLMAQYGVSRPTLREALRILEAESLLTIRRGSRGGATVHVPDVNLAARYAALILQFQGVTLADVYQARVVIEPPAVRQVAQVRDAAALGELRDLVDAAEGALDNGARFGEIIVKMHSRLVALAGNRTLELLLGMLEEILRRQTVTLIKQSDSRDVLRQNTRSLRAHRKLVDLIEAGEAAKAEAFWRNHLERAGEFLLRVPGPRTVVDVLGDPNQFI